MDFFNIESEEEKNNLEDTYVESSEYRQYEMKDSHSEKPSDAGLILFFKILLFLII